MAHDVTIERSVTLSYYMGVQDAARGTFGGGVTAPPHIDELHMDVAQDEVWDEATDGFVSSGKVQVNLRGSPRAYRAFATYLLSLCEYAIDPELADPDYHDHFDEVLSAAEEVAVHLIVHAPWRGQAVGPRA